MSSLRPLKVFLCHAHPDAEKVRALYARLKADGVDAWLDKENIIPGQDWEFETRKAVRESDIVVVCLSKQFSQKGYRQNEVRIALEEANLQPEGEIFIIPARLEECNYLESLKRFHGVDLFEERGYEYLMRALRLRAEKIGAVLQSKKGWLNGFTVPVKKSIPKKPQPIEKKPVSQPEVPMPDAVKQSLQKFKTQATAATVGAVVIFVIFSLAIFGLPWNQWFSNAPDITTITPTNIATITSPQPTLTNTKVPSTSTFAPVSPTKTKMPTLTATVVALPDEIVDERGVAMRLVTEGNFLMGSVGNLETIYADSFYIDKYEATNRLYKECIRDKKCDSPTDTKIGKVDYLNDEAYNNYPVVWVTQFMAKKFCEWREARLPTGIEWEKAARGIDGRIYPWGSETDLDLRTNGPGNSDGFSLTAPVGSFPLGASPYDVFDMAGNVSELVDDYGQSWDLVEYPIHRGGSWLYRGSGETLEVTSWGLASKWYTSYSEMGFRCAKDITP